MRSVIVKIGTVEDFLARSREIASNMDKDEPLQPEYTLTFEDPADMFSVMSAGRLEIEFDNLTMQQSMLSSE